MWQHLEVEDLLLYHKEKILLYYKEKIHESGRAFVLREVHHEECARRLNEKYGANFTWKQTYNKYHKLKGEWKVIMEAKSARGAGFDDVQKKITYDEIEVVKMKAKGDKKAKYYNVPIPLYDEMEFVFTGKHATGEFSVIEAPFDRSGRQEDDAVGNVNLDQEPADLNGDSSQHDFDTLPESDSPNPVGSKRRHEEKEKEKKEKEKKWKWARQGVPIFMQALSEAVSFTHGGTDPYEGIYKAIEDMDEYPLPARLDLLTYLAQNRHIASMLKGRQEETFKQWVARWVAGHYPL